MAAMRAAVATVLANPIGVACARRRMRARHVISWGLVTVAVTAFVFLIVYLTSTERGLLDRTVAAKSTILPLIVIQGVILMLLGTGSVASGIAQEREAGLLDYQRMTPMPPIAKIIGYLFGLPAREYLLFGLTLPFLVYAAVVGQIGPLKLANFYLIFFTSVFVYHLTGMVAGMVAEKPRRAALAAQGMVVLLYLVLPQLSWIGLTTLEFLTVRPTFYNMIMAEVVEIQPGWREAQVRLLMARYDDVAFFEWMLPATAFGLLLQGFVIVTLVGVVRRKWSDEHAHPFSKVFGCVFFLGTLVLLVGNLWPILHYPDRYADFYDQLERSLGVRGPLHTLWFLLFATLLLCGAAALLVIHLTTPVRTMTVRGLRQMFRLGRSRVPLRSDASTSLPVATAVCVLTAGGVATLLVQALRSGQFFDDDLPLLSATAMFLQFAVILLFFQALRERFSPRTTALVLFTLWALPVFALLIIVAAWSATVPAVYVGLPSPIVTLYVATAWFIDGAAATSSGVPRLVPSEMREHLPRMMGFGLVGYTVAAVAIQVVLVRWRRGLRHRESSLSLGQPA